MNRIEKIITITLLFFSTSGYAQDYDVKIKDYFKSKDYDNILKLVDKEKELNDTSLFSIAIAYYSKEQDENAIIYFNKSIDKNPRNPETYYYKALSCLYTNNLVESFNCIDKAISLKSDNPDYYAFKGELFANNRQDDSSLVYWQKASKFENCNGVVYLSLGDIYNSKQEYHKAITEYYTAKNKLEKNSTSYTNVLYNIGLTELLLNNYDKAEIALLELIEKKPEDYQAIAKLIQCYYAQKNYDKTIELKTKLYKAYDNKKLPENMTEMFCFDQFMWNNKRIMVFERFSETGTLYYKHLFYVPDENGEIDYRIQTEWSSAIESVNKKYVLGMDKGKTHYTFAQFMFDEKFDYDKLKECVINIMENKVKPSSSSTKK